MRVKHLLKWLGRPVLYALAGWAVACPLSGQATTTNVTVSDGSDLDAFVPNAVTINAGDRVNWVWSGSHNHTSTSLASPPLWDSGSLVNPASFGFTFANAGNYPYLCVIHGFRGSVTVQAANVPPSVAITSPANGAIFAAPWVGTIHATVSDPDDTVSKVDFFAGTNRLGTVSNPAANLSFMVTNLVATNYTLKAVATDSRGATNASAVVAIKVVTPVPIVLSTPRQVSASAFQLDYSANPGLSYEVLRSGALPVFSSISTNTATNSTVIFLDSNATGSVNFYGVHLLPNP